MGTGKGRSEWPICEHCGKRHPDNSDLINVISGEAPCQDEVYLLQLDLRSYTAVMLGIDLLCEQLEADNNTKALLKVITVGDDLVRQAGKQTKKHNEVDID